MEAPRARFWSPRTLARLLYALIGIEIVFQISTAYLSSMSDARTMGPLTDDCILMMPVPYAVLLAWTYVAYRNLKILDGSSRSKWPFEAVLAHFVPVANIAIPFGIYEEMSQACRLDTEDLGHRLSHSLPVALWLITYLASLVGIGSIAMPSMAVADGVPSASHYVTPVSVLALQNVFLLLTVRGITGRQIRKARSLELI